MFYFILHLSIADLLTAFFTLLPEVVWTLTFPDFHGGVVMCKFVKFTQMLGPYLSSYILIMTAVDRYQAICNPLGNCTWTPKRSKVRFLFNFWFNIIQIYYYKLERPGGLEGSIQEVWGFVEFLFIHILKTYKEMHEQINLTYLLLGL